MKQFILRLNGTRGIALVVVLALIAVLVLMAVAVHSISESELKAARVHSDGQEARQLSEVAVNIVMSQLRKATTQGGRAIGERTWVSQPGLVRCYERTGMSMEAYKLYSSGNMILRKPGQVESALLADVPDAKWRQMKDHYVDLNAPVFRTDASGTPRILFPILDPRAMSDKPTESVHGFSYKNKMLNGADLEGVVLQGGDAQRVPMPVKWLYVLQDGSVGVLNQGGNFIGERPATRENPIVGRIAFWTDDESSKININTASEPTYWATPIFTHERDAAYARYQPANGEFQRYPGHPATTALSPVLFPSQTLNAEQKESIYQLIPKISTGGSVAGTQSYLDRNVTAVNLTAARAERLFASVDELLLAENRTPNLIGSSPVTAEWVQKVGFFLTANSRSSEVNPFGLPKISIWPVSYRGPEYRTGFDQLMLHCSTLMQGSGKRSYIFQRGWADSLTQDVEYGDNQILLNYLKRLLSAQIPGGSESDTGTFKSKYDKDLPQILIEIFDYIRGTNLCDSFLARNEEKVLITGMSKMLGYETGNTRRTGFKTFTDPLNYVTANGSANAENGIAQGNGYPGHGQTTPSRWKANGYEVQGIGRFPTITEVGLHFICCADNTNDADNKLEEKYTFLGKPGGRGASRKFPIKLNDPDIKSREVTYNYWYSNFPPNPRPDPNVTMPSAADLAKYPATNGYPYGADKMHPGYQKFNWNHQLEANKPLRPGFRRVQARLLLEFFVPAHGYPAIQPELTVTVSGLGKLRLNGVPLFPNDQELLFTSNGDVPTHNNIIGGHGLGFNSLIGERYLPARSPMPPDQGWGNPLWIIKPAQIAQTEDLAVNNYNLVSNFVDIEVGMDGSKPMLIDGSGASHPLRIEIWSGHIGRQVTASETSAQLVQTLHVPIFDDSVQAPTLVRNFLYDPNKTEPPPVTSNDPEPISYWTFYSKGALGFNYNAYPDFDKNSSYSSGKFGANPKIMRGRLFEPNAGAFGPGGVPFKGAGFYGYDYPAVGVSRSFYPIVGPSITFNDIIKAEEKFGCDVVQSVLIAHGDYRHSACLANVPASDWVPHRYYGRRRLAHNFKRVVNTHPGFDYGGSVEPDKHLASITVNYHRYWSPDFPKFTSAATSAQTYGDFDNSFFTSDGAYINKPDEGNLNRVTFTNGVLPYLIDNTVNSVGAGFFSPNRMLSSPVMFGSLPTGVHGKVPWRTLLFRPQNNHFGAGSSVGGVSPPDHLFLEFFWMPVVEPYAISGPMVTAGKVNMNYQMFPFTHIRRATGMHAVLSGSEFSAVPIGDADTYHNDRGASGVVRDRYYSDALGKFWHHDVDVEKTLSQFETRFSQGKAFVYPSEICSIYLVPKTLKAQVSRESLESFWNQHRLTGDNVRERPYSSLYPRLTTKSNSYRVHCIAQSLKKSRAAPVDRMTDEDRVTGEYRGSTLIERYLDPSQPGMPDFADSQNIHTLDHFTQYRVIGSHRFGN